VALVPTSRLAACKCATWAKNAQTAEARFHFWPGLSPKVKSPTFYSASTCVSDTLSLVDGVRKVKFLLDSSFSVYLLSFLKACPMNSKASTAHR
jgi:hypothetical protein